MLPFGAKFLRNLARYMVNRVFKNNLSRSVLLTEWEIARSMVGMTLPAIPTVQSQKSLGFSMPKKDGYRAAFNKRLQLPRRNHNKRCRLADGATAKNILQDNIPRKKKKTPACSVVEQAGVRREQVIGGLRRQKGYFTSYPMLLILYFRT